MYGTGPEDFRRWKDKVSHDLFCKLFARAQGSLRRVRDTGNRKQRMVCQVWGILQCKFRWEGEEKKGEERIIYLFLYTILILRIPSTLPIQNRKLGNEDLDAIFNINFRNKLKHRWPSSNTRNVLTSLACAFLQLSHLKTFLRLLNKRLHFLR